MGRFRKLSQTIWRDQLHIFWVPKYRYRVLKVPIGSGVETFIRFFSERQHCEVQEVNVLIDHVHPVVMIPPKVSISTYLGTVKGRSAICVLRKFCKL